MTDNLFRVYNPDKDLFSGDGYPWMWHDTIKHLVREQAGHRCVRCGHPYRNGEHGNGEWSRCDSQCTHRGPVRLRGIDRPDDDWVLHDLTARDMPAYAAIVDEGPSGMMDRYDVEARWRILTVHHLNGDKADCRWWNIVPLCQRCHLQIQGKVVLMRVYPWPHSGWFRPYVAGWYAWSYLGEDLTREETEARMDELLALELA